MSEQQVPEGQRAIARLARDADVLAAFRKVTGWDDEDVLHYASCGDCTPICGSQEENCPGSPATVTGAKYVAERAQRLAAQRKARQ